MFSHDEKVWLAAEVEKLLLKLQHPEMPLDKPRFELRVVGKQAWSYATIEPNWRFTPDNPPGVNLWNEVARVAMSKPQGSPCGGAVTPSCPDCGAELGTGCASECPGRAENA